MKKLLLIPLFLMLFGCASHYYPVAEAEAGPYYVEGDSSYYTEEDQAYVDYSVGYASSRYYPWWSIDYLYLGSHYPHSNFSIGFGIGSSYYNGWNDPFYAGYFPYSYYDYYFPLRYSYWYSPFYRHSYSRYGWNDHYWHHRYNRHYRSYRGHNDGWERSNRGRHADNNRNRNSHDRDTGTLGRNVANRDQDRFAPRDRSAENNRRRGEDGPVPPAGEAKNPAGGGGRTTKAPLSRHVSVAPGRRSSGKSMEIRNRGERKPGPTRMQPVKPVARITPSPDTVVQVPRQSSPAYTSSRSAGTEVRNRTGNKQGKTRTTPVESYSPPGTVRAVPQRSTRVVSSRRGASTVRSPSQGKPGQMKLPPVRTQPQGSLKTNSSLRVVANQPTRRAKVPQQRPSAPRQQAPARPRQSSNAPAKPRYSAPPRQSSQRPASTSNKANRPSVSSKSSGKGPSRADRKNRR